jgi:phosphate:Na+ symporter
MLNLSALIPMIGLLAGGLTLFLLGLELMTGALTAAAGSRLQEVLSKLTANRFLGVLAGAFVTAVLNSSTITTVLMVGFVSAGLMSLSQTVPMIMGANIGSTITAQIIAFDLKALTPFMLAVGFLLRALGRNVLLRQLGSIVLGLGLLFLGIQFMGDATRPLRTFQPFIDLMQEMRNPLIGIILGAIFTAVVQSSAATLAIVIALASQGLMPLEAGIALVLGANIGTCGTAMLASIGKSAEAVQVGVVHLLFNFLGVLFWVFLIPQLADLVRHISPTAPDLQGLERLAAETPRQVANTHTIFSVVNTLILIWFAGPLARLAQRIVPSRPKEIKSTDEPVYLEESALTVPALGLERVRLELARMGELTLAMVQRARRIVVDGQREDLQKLLTQDDEIDKLESAILVYLDKLSLTEHTDGEGRQMIGLAQISSALESVGDVVTTNLVSLGQQRVAEQIDLLRLRNESTSEFASLVIGNLEQAIATIGHPDVSQATQVIAAKSAIQERAAAARQSLLANLQLSEKKDVLSFRLANDMIEHFKQIAYFARQIAEVSLEGQDYFPRGKEMLNPLTLTS